MAVKYYKHEWQEMRNGVTIDCSLDIAIHPSNSKVILLTIPGVDGSVDGYKNKYVTIAENVQKQHGAAVVRMSNPFVTSFHWESNIRHIMDFIDHNIDKITDQKDYELRIMAHSAGAAMIAQLSHKYQQITHLLLINPAITLGEDKIKTGLTSFKGKTTILLADQDPNYEATKQLVNDIKNPNLILEIAKNTDHNFSGKSFNYFKNASLWYIFN